MTPSLRQWTQRERASVPNGPPATSRKIRQTRPPRPSCCLCERCLAEAAIENWLASVYMPLASNDTNRSHSPAWRGDCCSESSGASPGSAILCYRSLIESPYELDQADIGSPPAHALNGRRGKSTGCGRTRGTSSGNAWMSFCWLCIVCFSGCRHGHGAGRRFAAARACSHLGCLEWCTLPTPQHTTSSCDLRTAVYPVCHILNMCLTTCVPRPVCRILCIVVHGMK